MLDLLELFKVTTFDLEDEMYLLLSIHNAKSFYYGFNQGKSFLCILQEFFMNEVEVATSYGVQLHVEVVLKQVCQEKHGNEGLSGLTVVLKDKIDLETHNKNKYVASSLRIIRIMTT